MAIASPVERTLAFSLILDGVLWSVLDVRALRRSLGKETNMLIEHFESFFARFCYASVLLPDDANAATVKLVSCLEYWSARAASAVLPIAEQAWTPVTDEILGASMSELAIRGTQQA